ncbi:hypothetical protein AB0I34_34805 [Kribbella sp. NPDC050281]|uniref:hypothetical protein n=1 Tax=Kribbella sp. NPDC050281 TaxID=3155515 RepID=UPI003411041C
MRTATMDRTPRHRHGFGRRDLLFGAAGFSGAAVGGGLLTAPTASAGQERHRQLSTAAARPIPGGFQLTPGGEVFHVVLVGQGEPSTITDFKGVVGATIIDGRGTGANSAHAFEVDVRFMDGTFIGLDGKRNVGTFGFY